MPVSLRVESIKASARGFQRLPSLSLLPTHLSSPTRQCSLVYYILLPLRHPLHASRSPTAVISASDPPPPTQVRAISPLRVVGSAILLTRVHCLAALPANTLLVLARPPRAQSFITRARSSSPLSFLHHTRSQPSFLPLASTSTSHLDFDSSAISTLLAFDFTAQTCRPPTLPPVAIPLPFFPR